MEESSIVRNVVTENFFVGDGIKISDFLSKGYKMQQRQL